MENKPFEATPPTPQGTTEYLQEILETKKNGEPGILRQLEQAPSKEAFEALRKKAGGILHIIEYLLLTGHPNAIDELPAIYTTIEVAERTAAERLGIEPAPYTPNSAQVQSTQLLRLIARLKSQDPSLERELLSPIRRLTAEELDTALAKRYPGQAHLSLLQANRVLKARLYQFLSTHDELEQGVQHNELPAFGLEVNDLSCSMNEWDEDFTRNPTCAEAEYAKFKERFLALVERAKELNNRLEQIGHAKINDLSQKCPEHTAWYRDFSQFETDWLKYQLDRIGRVDNAGQ